MSMANSLIVPPVFGAMHEGFLDETDLDLDFKILSEYLFDDNAVMQQAAPQLPKRATSKAKGAAKGGATKKRGKKSISVDDGLAMSGIDDSLGYDDFGDEFSDDDIREDDKDVNGKSRQRVDKRRERNRVLARKTRLRKKFFFESLQRQVAQLTKENEMLKSIATTHLKPETLKDLLTDCAELPPCVVSSTQHANSILEKADFKLISAIQNAQRSFCLTDPSLPDNPIVFASPGFLELTGYTMEQVLGKNCRFLQGPRTDPGQIGLIKQGLAEGKDVSVCFINYKADGTEFYNQLFIGGLRDSNHNLVNYVGVLAELSKRSASEEALLDESLGRPAKKGRPKKTDKDDKNSNKTNNLLPMPPPVPSKVRQQQQEELFRNYGNTMQKISFKGIKSHDMKTESAVPSANGDGVVQDSVPELNFSDVDFTEIIDLGTTTLP